VQIGLKGGTTMGQSGITSNIRPEALCGLLEEIQPLVVPRGVAAEALSIAFKESLLEIGEKNIGNSAEEIRSNLIGLILCKLFARRAALWISAQTKAGNQVPLGILVAAYSAWKNASNLAARHGMDAIAAADALVQVTHDTADLIAKNKEESESEGIRDVYHYLYTGYKYSIRRIAAKQTLNAKNSVEIGEWIEKYKQEFSDNGAFWKVIDNGILCRELLNTMQPKGRSVANARYLIGYSWPEIANSVGTSINAAQKALSFGIRTAFEIYGQELPGMGFRKIANIKNPQFKKKKTRVRRKIGDDHERQR
jgi:hypothetical protein